ncbi:MAG: arsenate reductase ArsC [Flavobacteriales bacterium]|nr:arsenate reductase ArsC [Flavobacteriales bacterium]
MNRKNILVLCTGNSCRSQIAEGYLRHFTGGKHAIYSAGIETHGVNPRAIETMAEDHIDISGHTSNHIDEYREVPFDLVITVCDHARENCPWFPTEAERVHHSFTDPAKATGSEGEIKKAFADTRDEIREYCRKLVADKFNL